MKTADEDFEAKKEEAKRDFDARCELYRSYIGGAETSEERARRIRNFRKG